MLLSFIYSVITQLFTCCQHCGGERSWFCLWNLDWNYGNPSLISHILLVYWDSCWGLVIISENDSDGEYRKLYLEVHCNWWNDFYIKSNNFLRQVICSLHIWHKLCLSPHLSFSTGVHIKEISSCVNASLVKNNKKSTFK